MDQEKLDEIVSLAEGASEKLTDKTLKELTYKTVLTQLLQQSTVPAATPTPSQQPIVGTSVTAPSQANSSSPAGKVAAWAGISEDLLSELFDFGDDNVRVQVPHSKLPKKISDAQRLLAHLKLAVEKIGYDNDEVSAQAMLEVFDEHACKDKNTAKNIKSSQYIVPSSGKKGTMKSYKMRFSGLTFAQQEIRNVLGIQA